MILKVLVFLILIYFVLKLVGRILLPLYIVRRLKKIEEARVRAERDYILRKKRDEGKVTVSATPGGAGNSYSGKGEYVDFEEVK